MNFLLFNWDFSQKLWHWQNKTRKKLDERCFSNFLSFFMQEKNFNVTLEDVSRDMGMLSLQGPLSRRILQKLTPGNTDLSEEGFPFSTCQTLTVAGHQVLALRVSFVGEVGWELHIPRDACVPIYRSLMEAGRPLGLVNAGYRAIGKDGYAQWV